MRDAARLARALLLLGLVTGCWETSGDRAYQRLAECEDRANRELDPYLRDTHDRQCKLDEDERARAEHTH